MRRALGAFLLIAGLCSGSAVAEKACTEERPALLPVAEILKEQFEILDEVLHAAAAPPTVVGPLHHFEEGILEFLEELRAGATCTKMLADFQHFHEDVQMVYGELSKLPELFHRKEVLEAWNRFLPSYIAFQNTLYRR